jgi:hypothetical protein
MTKDTGGPAFPFTCEKYHSEGMTLRDYFAAKAMEGLIANNNQYRRFSAKESLCQLRTDAQEIAQAAYIIADAMLERRKV